MTSRPLYWPQCGQTRCGTLGSWQLGHSAKAGLARESWARRFCVRAFECRRFGFGMADSCYFPYLNDCTEIFPVREAKPVTLLLFREVKGRKAAPPVVAWMRFAVAFRLIPVDSAKRADALAVLPAQVLHGELKQDLFPHDVFEKQAGELVKPHFGLAFVDGVFFSHAVGLGRFIVEVERGVDMEGSRPQTAVARSVEIGNGAALDADLASGVRQQSRQTFCGKRPALDGSGIGEVDRAGLPDAVEREVADLQLLDSE